MSHRDERGHLGYVVGVAVPLDLEVVVGLDVDPEAVVDAEGLGQAQGRLGRDGTLAPNDLADPRLGECGGLSQAVLRTRV